MQTEFGAVYQDSEYRLWFAKRLSIGHGARGEAVAGFIWTEAPGRAKGSGVSSQRKPPARAKRYHRLIALCVGSILAGTAGYAGDTGPGPSTSSATIQADPGVEALLGQLERQITIGHTMTPEGDNALVTWLHLHDSMQSASPATLKVLEDFATHARHRAAEEQAAGRWVIAIDLMVFADRTAELLRGKNVETAPVPPASVAIASDPPPPVSSRADIPTPPANTRTSDSPSVPAPSAETVALVTRGDALLANKDISAARTFYELAASAGSARAAMALAQTYDPVFLNRIGAVGTRPDPAMARDWYRKAAALGGRDTEVRLKRLGMAAAE
jgi:hypothetical protein